MKNKYIASLIALFGGVIGLHRFYLGQYIKGIIYIILALLTMGILPIILSLLEIITYLCNSKEEFDIKYNAEYIKNKKTVINNK